MTFLNPVENANPYLSFGYGSLKISYHTRGKISGLMNSDAVNSKHISTAKKGSIVRWTWRGFLGSTKTNNWCQQVWTPKHHPWHNLPQACGGSKPVCPF